ncbi:MAG: hypothetical protein OQK00_02960 [Rhodobacteraceae bacterium]|nr:hypothetical protein [Paracoccaceae bacterium]
MKTLGRLLRILPPILLAVAATVWLVSYAKPPARIEQAEMQTTARTMIATPKPIRLFAQGYGTIRPAWSWQAVAEVAGSITFRHPDLETGNILPAGTKVLEIDPTPYDIAARQAEADLTALMAERDQIAADHTNTTGILEIERERLTLARTDLDRVRALVERGAAPQSRLDDLERATLQLKRAVRELENALSLTPIKTARLDAQIARSQAGLERSKRDLDLTQIVTPQAMRIGKVHVERYQFTQPGTPLVSGDSIDRVEVTAQIPVDAFSRLIGTVADSIDLAQGGQEALLAQLSAELRLVTAPNQTWTGRVLRIENALDAEARSVPVVIAVDHPYEGAAPPRHLPLVPNMYVQATLSAPSKQARIAIPAKAIHNGLVYLRNSEGRLALRDVTPAWQQDDMVVIETGLAAGDEVILDDILPAIPGMRIHSVESSQ